MLLFLSISFAAGCAGSSALPAPPGSDPSEWAGIESWLSGHAPALGPLLNAPATQAELDEAERTMGGRFPPSVRAAYLVHDGESKASAGIFGLWRLLPMAEVVREHEARARAELKHHFGTFTAGRDLPLLISPGGEMVSVQASSHGEETAVYEHPRHGPRQQVAPSFAIYLRTFTANLEAGNLVYKPDELQGLISKDDL